MSHSEHPAERISELAQSIGQLAAADNMIVAVAESLTSGRIAQALGAAPESSTWFAGGVVAYQSETKHRLLGVPRGPVVTGECADQMARAVLDRLGADVSVAVTGVGGPGPEEGHPAGTVYISVSSRCTVRTFAFTFHGDPGEVVDLTTIEALTHLRKLLLET